ncbi:MAG: hypothetical protein H5T66_15435, partial [Chloroflexi bacterium]|nr:hypothetical protein [Chloroflexota bacterium]
MEDSHIPFECLVFGHPDIFDDAEQLKRLPRYQAVVVIGADCMTASQIQALSRYAQAGGTVVVMPPLGSRDEDGWPAKDLSRPQALTEPPAEDLAAHRTIERRLGRGRVVWLAPDIMSDWQAGGDRKEKAFAECRDVLRKAIGDRLWLETDAPASVWTEPWLCGNGRLVGI